MRIIIFIVFTVQVGFGQKVLDPLIKSTQPIICGHRGGFYPEFPENSLSVNNHVQNQIDQSSLFLEVDIRQSKSGTLYILHDESVDRTTNGKGNLADLSDDYIDQLFLKVPSGKLSEDRILKLADLLDKLKESKISLMLDIKSNAWREVAELIVKKGWASRCLFLTFKTEDAQQLISISDQLYISVLIRNKEDWQRIKGYPKSVQYLVAYVERKAGIDFISYLKSNGLKMMADVSEHTTNQGILYGKDYYQQRIKDQQLDILITDFPIEVSKMIGNY